MEQVIIIDDELSFLNYMKKQVQKFSDVQVVGCFENGLRAQEFLEKNTYVTIAFVDIQMPVMNGLELAKWINANLPGIKIVLISAYQDFQYAQEAICANVYRYLCKPFRTCELTSIFEAVAQLRLQEEKQRLYIRDMDRERENLALFRSITSGEKNFIRVDWSFSFQTPIPGHITDSMLTTALWNILRYCSSHVRALVTIKRNAPQAVLMVDDASKLPDASCFEQKAEALLGFEVKVIVLAQSSLEQLSDFSLVEVYDDASNIIEQAKAYIQKNISTELNRDDVANAVYMSPSHFSRFFRKEIGVSFQDYVKKVRLEKVMELLKQGYKISEASAAAGFTNKNYFNEVFRKEIGCSPSEYKKLAKQVGDDL